jgi:HEAT repeat protein
MVSKERGKPMSEVQELIRKLDSEDFLERTKAAIELGKRGAGAANAVPALIRVLAGEEKRESSRFEKIDWTDPIEKQTYALAGRAAIKALSQIGKPAVSALISALSDPDPMVRTGVAEALGFMGKDAEDAVAQLLFTARNDPDEFVRMAAAKSSSDIHKEA